MSRSSVGYIKLWRSIDVTMHDADGYAIAIWDTLLRWAVRSDSPTDFCGKEIVLKPGQIKTSMIELCNRLKFPKKIIANRLEGFSKGKRITVLTGNKGAIITIINWERYQCSEELEGKQRKNKGKTNATLRRIEKKEERNKYRYCEFEMQIAKKWIDCAKIIQSEHNPGFNPDLEQCANAIRLMRSSDKITNQQLEMIVEHLRTCELHRFDDHQKFWTVFAETPMKVRGKTKQGDRRIDRFLIEISKLSKKPHQKQIRDNIQILKRR